MKRGVPLTRNAPPGWGMSLRRVPRVTAFSPEVELAVRTRAGQGDPAGAICEACAVWLGRRGGQITRRRAAFLTGRGEPPSLVSLVVNALLLCGTPFAGCAGLAESRDVRMHGMGFWVTSDQYPRLEPVKLYGESGGGVTVWLTEDGRWSFDDRAALALPGQ